MVVHEMPLYGTLDDALRASSALFSQPCEAWLTDVVTAVKHATQYVSLTSLALEDFHLQPGGRLKLSLFRHVKPRAHTNVSVLESTGEEDYNIYKTNESVVEDWILALRKILTCIKQGTVYTTGDDFRYVDELSDIKIVE